MTTNTYSFLRSGTFYTFVIMFLIGGFQNVDNLLPAGITPVILGALGLLGTYLHVSLATKMGAVN